MTGNDDGGTPEHQHGGTGQHDDHDHDHDHDHDDPGKGDGAQSAITVTTRPIVIPQRQLSGATGQTEGMQRLVAVDENMVGASTIFMAYGTAPGRSQSEAHHHGIAETAGYCISGRQKIYFGTDYADYLVLTAGDFVYVPPMLPHIEVNEWKETYVGIVARSPSNIVVNIGWVDILSRLLADEKD